jgi:hypothetical protein
MRKHRIQQRFTYNMDEKGFMLGVEGRQRDGSARRSG